MSLRENTWPYGSKLQCWVTATSYSLIFMRKVLLGHAKLDTLGHNSETTPSIWDEHVSPSFNMGHLSKWLSKWKCILQYDSLVQMEKILQLHDLKNLWFVRMVRLQQYFCMRWGPGADLGRLFCNVPKTLFKRTPRTIAKQAPIKILDWSLPLFQSFHFVTAILNFIIIMKKGGGAYVNKSLPGTVSVLCVCVHVGGGRGSQG